MFFTQSYAIILDMNNKELEDFKKISQKRNFYTTTDAGRVFLLGLLLPLVIGLLFAYISMTCAKAAGITFAEDANYLTELFNNYLWFSIPFSLISQIVFFATYFGYNKINRISQKSCNLSFKKTNWKTALLCMGLGILSVLGFILLIEGAFGNLFRAIGLKSNALALPNNTVGWLFVNLLILGVVPPICEELLFRGIIFNGLKERFSNVVSIVFTALLFALMHQNIQQFVYPFVLGIVLTTIMHKTNNLIYPILLHMFNNFTTLILDYLFSTGVIKFSFAGMAWWWYLIAIAAAAVVCTIFYLLYRFYLAKHERVEVEKEGECHQIGGMNLGKFPIALVIGFAISIVMIVINAI